MLLFAPAVTAARWLTGHDAQQCCQLFCADAQLLLGFINLAATAAEACGSNPAVGRGGLELQQLQVLLLPYLEQQQLLAVLCWGAGQCYSCCQALLLEDQQQQQQQEAPGMSQGLLAHKAAACCLSMQLSGACAALLEGLVLAGCCCSQIARLKQQLQQQLQAIMLSQQQQGCGHSGAAAAAVDAGLDGNAAQCVSAGALQVLSPIQGVEGSAVGRVQGVCLQLLGHVYAGGQGFGPVMGVSEPLGVAGRLQQLLHHLQRA